MKIEDLQIKSALLAHSLDRVRRNKQEWNFQVKEFLLRTLAKTKGSLAPNFIAKESTNSRVTLSIIDEVKTVLGTLCFRLTHDGLVAVQVEYFWEGYDSPEQTDRELGIVELGSINDSTVFEFVDRFLDGMNEIYSRKVGSPLSSEPIDEVDTKSEDELGTESDNTIDETPLVTPRPEFNPDPVPEYDVFLPPLTLIKAS